MPTFPAVLIYSPLASAAAKNLEDAGEVFADEAMTQPLTVFVGGSRTPKSKLSTSKDGICEEFQTTSALRVWTRWPLASAATGVSHAQEMRSLEVGKLQDAATGAVNAVQEALTSVETARRSAERAAATAADMKELQIASQSILDANGKFILDRMPPEVLNSSGGSGSVASGTDTGGTWIQTNGSKLYFLLKSELSAAVNAMASKEATPSMLAVRDTAGRLGVTTPVVAADAANKAYVDGTAAAQAVAAVAGVPRLAYHDGTNYRWDSMAGEIVTKTNRPANRPTHWYFGPDPATLTSVTVADYDQWWAAEA